MNLTLNDFQLIKGKKLYWNKGMTSDNYHVFGIFIFYYLKYGVFIVAFPTCLGFILVWV